MSSLCRCLCAAMALVLIPVPVGRDRALAADAGSLVIIVDGSGSMWGTIEGARQTKLFMAREALRRSLGKLSPRARVGLTQFGHRRGDCSDVEVVRPPDTLDVAGVIGPLEQLNPRGRGPITLAVREAAKALPRSGSPGTILLIHDDADNCQPDLCAAAAELRAAHVTAHVVGLGTKADDMAKMACLTQVTGGRHFNAQSGEQAASYIEEALLLAASGMGGVASLASPAPSGAIVPPSPVPASGPPALHLRALLAPNTEPVSTPLYWTVTAENRPNAALYGARAINPSVPVSPGRYIVEVRDGTVSARQVVEVRENRPAAVTMVLNAGVMRVRVLGRKTPDLLPDALVTVMDANGALLVASKAAEVTALVPAGRHQVRAELGLVRAEQTVTVAPGRMFAVDMPLGTARLQLTTAGRDGRFGLDAPIFSVEEDDPDARGGRREVARSAAQPAEFVLPPGTYYVIARQGAVEIRERLAVGPGDVVSRPLTVAVGTLTLSTKAPPFGSAKDTPISYTVTRTDGSPQEVISTSQPSPALLLPAGRYRVEGRYGLMNVRTAREVEIKAGQTLPVVLEHEAAALRLRVTGSGPADVAWIIRDQAGKAVWTGAHTEAVANLQAGRYVVRAETRNKRDERAVELRAGDAKLLEFSVD